MGATIAYKQAALNAITYLGKIGYSEIISRLYIFQFGGSELIMILILLVHDQAYMVLSAAPIGSHIGAIVDSPNACVMIGIPTAIFDQDILPKPEGFRKQDFGWNVIGSNGAI
ncbi:hypothetical protein H2248_002351 [Termitomyces sp. 'cryptogamus']|nr:hypothetical protein H2248_002351 [Termitomyces sp. 'cryptogamus']